MELIWLIFGAFYGLAVPALVFWLVAERARMKRQMEDLERGQGELRRVLDAERRAGEVPGAGGPEPAPPAAAVPLEEKAPAAPPPVPPEAPAADAVAPSPPARPAAAAARGGETLTRPAQDAAAPGETRGAIVFTPARAAALTDWLRENWFLAAAAVSLALAGVFLVQYGIEQGYLTPAMRALGAVALGAVLILAGEAVRRRLGAADAQIRDAIASAFAGAGIVSIFAGVLAARLMYGLIGPELAFAALAATAALAVALGWFHGPFLASVGLIGGAAAPFLVGGAAEEPYWLYAYFALIAALGLAIDAAKREAWLSVLALGAGYAGATMLYLGAGGALWFAAFALGAVAMAAAIPVWSLVPRHEGVTVSGAIRSHMEGRGGAWPEFPARLVAGTVLAAALVAWRVAQGDVAEFAVACAALGLLFALIALWLRDAPALADLAAVPVLTLVAVLGYAALAWLPGYEAFADWVAPEMHPETPPPAGMSWLVGGAVAAGLMAALRAGAARGAQGLWWAVLAAVTAPAVVIVLELFWQPALVIGDFAWALHVMGVAVVLTLLAGWQARIADRREMRVSAALTMALTMVSLALILWFSYAALTLALALMVLAAALLDARFGLAPMGVFIAVGVAALGWRLIFLPGLYWSMWEASLGEALLSHLGVIGALLAARAAARQRARRRIAALTEAGAAVAAGLLASVLVVRGVDREEVWQLSIHAGIALVVALGLLRRAEPGAGLRWLTLALAVLAGLIAAVLLVGIVVFNPMSDPLFADPVRGPVILDTLLVQYGLPGAVLLAAPRIARLRRAWALWAVRASGAGFLALYAGFEIRRIWRGPDLSVPGVTDAELYSYTVAMMLTAAGLMLAAWTRRSQMLRRLGVLAAAATIAKVFLIDMSGLAGLIRVASFLALGLSLAALALVNRWIVRSMEGETGEAGEAGKAGKDG